MLELSIIYEDQDILVVDKPAGAVMHPFDFSNEETLLDVATKHAPEILSVNNQKKLQDGRTINLGGLVHKLDRETSGVVVFAKNKEIFDTLSSQFKNHQVEKTYYAKIEGVMREKTFTIDAPLAREKKSFKQTANPETYRGELRQAITYGEVVSSKNNETIVKLMPRTGRTHQLRVHMAHIGHPIVGDTVYGKATGKRLMLHAQKLSFTLENVRFEYVSPIPIEFDV